MSPKLANVLDRVRSNTLLRNLSAYCASEAAAKASRLLAVIALARVLTPAQVGIVAGALAISELFKALAENGTVQKIIAAPADELDAVCHAARRINAVWSVGLFALQVLVAFAIYKSTGQIEGPLLIALMAGEYLFMPFGLVQCGLAMREGKLGGTAAVAGAQNVLANALTALVIFIWPNPAAVALARLATTPVWLVGMRRLRPWKPQQGVAHAPVTSFVRFGSSVLGVEFLKVLRMQADKLIVGGLMGPEALGIYFFAFNAGYGIANSFSVAFSIVLFPHLCNSDDRAATLRKSVGMALLVLFPAVCLQAFAAQYYVPLIFGAKWASVAPLVSILCFAALPAVIWSAAAQWHRSVGRPEMDLVCSAFIAAFITCGILVAYPFGLTAVVWSVLATSVVSQVLAAAVSVGAAFVPTQKQAGR
ncbi:oligosaccharide flippase family protein [Oricola sp.]|uniref:oligosaccharide flippase family protein n=1 Tax=Oricola sp. TaxID=1979950 RepID=UPI003BAC25B3